MANNFEKNYDGKISGRDFDVLNRCQKLCSDIFIASAGAAKEYRFTCCKVIQSYSCELVHSCRQANGYQLGSDERKNQHDISLEYIEKIADMLPVIRRCRCISIGQEKELNKKLCNLKISYNKWVNSDKNRISQKTLAKG